MVDGLEQVFADAKRSAKENLEEPLSVIDQQSRDLANDIGSWVKTQVYDKIEAEPSIEVVSLASDSIENSVQGPNTP